MWNPDTQMKEKWYLSLSYFPYQVLQINLFSNNQCNCIHLYGLVTIHYVYTHIFYLCGALNVHDYHRPIYLHA